MSNKYLEKIAATIHEFPDRGKNRRDHNKKVFEKQELKAAFGMAPKLKKTPPPTKENIHNIGFKPKALARKYGYAMTIGGIGAASIAGSMYVNHKLGDKKGKKGKKMNKYLEKIAKMNTLGALRSGTDVYQLHGAVRNKRKKKNKTSATASRKWNRGAVKKAS
jgi:hypothetical protein